MNTEIEKRSRSPLLTCGIKKGFIRFLNTVLKASHDIYFGASLI